MSVYFVTHSPLIYNSSESSKRTPLPVSFGGKIRWHCTEQYYSKLHSALCTSLYGTSLYYTLQYFTLSVLYFTGLHFTYLRYSRHYRIVMKNIFWYFSTFSFTALKCTLQYANTALLYITINYSVFFLLYTVRYNTHLNPPCT